MLIIFSVESLAVNTNSYEDVIKAIQEVAYSYYMRGTNIQYNSMKGDPSWFSPEEATRQNTNYVVCSAFTKNVYYDLLGIKIPPYSSSLIQYCREHVGNSEVVAYGCKEENDFVMKLYDPTAENNYTIITNPSLEDIIPYLKIRRCAYIYRTCTYGI